MTSSTGKQVITSHTLPNILRSEINQTMKYWHLLKYNTRNIFLDKSYKKYDIEKSPRHFSKNQNITEHISG